MLAGIVITSCAGGTFLTWSLYYLAGNTQYHDPRRKMWDNIPDNPLIKSESNAHNFYPICPRNLEEFNACYDGMKDRSDLNILYLIQRETFDQDDINDKLRLFDRMLYVDLDSRYLRYFSKFEERTQGRRRLNDTSIFQGPTHETYSSWEEQHQDYIQTFFSQSLKEFGSIEEPWNHREFLALNLDWRRADKVSDFYDRSRFDHFYLDNVDVWMRLDQSIHHIFDYLGIEIDRSRLENWREIYFQWKRFHEDRINFCIYSHAIVDAIVRGIDMDLTRFNLDIVQEADLLRSLMLDHGLTLRAHGLVKFTNARDLHALLEPNFHKLTH